MKEAAAVGVVAGILTALVLGGVSLFRDIKARSQQTEETYRLACESTGGKAAWNLKYWECLK